MTFLKNFSKLIVIKHSKLGPKCDRKKHNSVISSIIHKQIQLFTFVQGKTGNKLNFYRSKPHKSLHVEKSNFWHMDSICEYVYRNKKKPTVEEIHIDFLGISTCCLVGQDKILCLQELIPF